MEVRIDVEEVEILVNFVYSERVKKDMSKVAKVMSARVPQSKNVLPSSCSATSMEGS